MINSVLIKMSPKTIYYYTSASNLDSFRLIIRSASCHHLLYWHQTCKLDCKVSINQHPSFKIGIQDLYHTNKTYKANYSFYQVKVDS